jgi:hypothetical protein
MATKKVNNTMEILLKKIRDDKVAIDLEKPFGMVFYSQTFIDLL